MKISVFGAGTWGTALAALYASNGHEIILWSAIPDEIEYLKSNHEHKNLPGFKLSDEVILTTDVEAAARVLQAAGACNVLVSLGGDGALLLDETGRVHRAPAVGGKPVNTVGAGDSMVAGFLSGVRQGYDYALRLGIAAGSATATSLTLATREEIERLL